MEVEDSIDDFITLYAAGNATTAATIIWSLGELTRAPHVMEKLVEEVWSFASI